MINEEQWFEAEYCDDCGEELDDCQCEYCDECGGNLEYMGCECD
jgi:hypothetical protein